MAVSFGIDVSEHNGTINWKKVKSHISFAMIRAGYGSNTVDSKFKENANACTNLKIPFGVYWFSYALDENMARKEAKKCLSVVKPYKLSCPIAFDFEYDSLRYAEKQNKRITPSKMCSIACAFLDHILANGYQVLLYTNYDFWHNYGFKNLGNRYPIWCASWGTEKPSIYCSMWQDSAAGTIDGIDTKVDTDVSYVRYYLPKDLDKQEEEIAAIVNEYGEIYKDIAVKIIEGAYGNGDDRIGKLLAEKRDPQFAQEIVNIMMKDG